MADDPTHQIVDLVKLLIHMHETLDEKKCLISAQTDFKLKKGYLKKILNKLDAQGAESISGGFQKCFFNLFLLIYFYLFLLSVLKP